MSVTLASASIFNTFSNSERKVDALLHGHSYTAYPIACEIASETLAALEEMESSGQWDDAKKDWSSAAASSCAPNGSRSREVNLPPQSRVAVTDGHDAELQQNMSSPRIWSFWSKESVHALSCCSGVDSAMALGTVLAVQLRDEENGGEHSENAVAAAASFGTDMRCCCRIKAIRVLLQHPCSAIYATANRLSRTTLRCLRTLASRSNWLSTSMHAHLATLSTSCAASTRRVAFARKWSKHFCERSTNAKIDCTRMRDVMHDETLEIKRQSSGQHCKSQVAFKREAVFLYRRQPLSLPGLKEIRNLPRHLFYSLKSVLRPLIVSERHVDLCVRLCRDRWDFAPAVCTRGIIWLSVQQPLRHEQRGYSKLVLEEVVYHESIRT